MNNDWICPACNHTYKRSYVTQHQRTAKHQQNQQHFIQDLFNELPGQGVIGYRNRYENARQPNLEVRRQRFWNRLQQSSDVDLGNILSGEVGVHDRVVSLQFVINEAALMLESGPVIMRTVQYEGERTFLHRINNVEQLQRIITDSVIKKFSDPEEIDVLEYDLFRPDQDDEAQEKFQMRVRERQINRSKRGKGTDDVDVDIQIIDNEFVYIPSTGACLKKCFCYLAGRDVSAEFDKFIANYGKKHCNKARNRIDNDNIPQAVVSKIAKGLQLPIKVYNPKEKVRKDIGYVYLHDGHYIVMKKPCRQLIGLVPEMFNYVPRDLVLNNENEFSPVNLVVKLATYHQQVQDVFIWDSETYYRKLFIPYALGIMRLSDIADIRDIDKKVDEIMWKKGDLINIITGRECIDKMIDWISSQYRRTVKKIHDDDKVEYEDKKNVWAYAHNSSGFDSYLVEEWMKTHKYKSAIKSGSKWMELKVETDTCIIIFRCTMTHIIGSLEKACETYRLPEALCKKSMDHQNMDENYMDRIHEWYEYLQFDVISLAIIWSKYIKSMHKVTGGLDIRTCISSASLAWKSYIIRYKKMVMGETEEGQEVEAINNDISDLFRSRYELEEIDDEKFKVLRGALLKKESEALKRYNKKLSELNFLCQFKDRQLVKLTRRSVHGGMVRALKNMVFETKSEGLKWAIFEVYGTDNLDDIVNIQKYGTTNVSKIAKIKNEVKLKKMFTGKMDNRFSADGEENIWYLNWLTSQVVNEHEQDFLIPFDATSLYPSAMNSIENFPDIRSYEPIKDDMTYEEIKARYPRFILECDIHLPKECQFPPVPVKLTEKQFLEMIGEDSKGASGVLGCYYVLGNIKEQVYGDIDLSQVIRIGGSVTKVHRGIGFRKVVPNTLKEFVDEYFKLRKVYQGEGQDLLADGCKLILNSCYGKTVQKDIETVLMIKDEEIFHKKYNDESVKRSYLLPNGQVMFEKVKSEKELEKGVFPSILGSYILQQSKKIMNDFVEALNGFTEKIVWYQDTDSLYIHLSQYEKLAKAGHVGKNLCQGKNDFGTGGIMSARFIGPKQKLCYVFQFGQISKKVTFKGVYSKSAQDIGLLAVRQMTLKTSHEAVLGNMRDGKKSKRITKGYTATEKDKFVKNAWQIGKGIQLKEMSRTVNNKSQLVRFEVEDFDYKLRYIE